MSKKTRLVKIQNTGRVNVCLLEIEIAIVVAIKQNFCPIDRHTPGRYSKRVLRIDNFNKRFEKNHNFST